MRNAVAVNSLPYTKNKQKIEAQEQTISRLRDLIKNPGIDPGQALDVLQDLINKQNAEFQKLMKKFS